MGPATFLYTDEHSSMSGSMTILQPGQAGAAFIDHLRGTLLRRPEKTLVRPPSHLLLPGLLLRMRQSLRRAQAPPSGQAVSTFPGMAVPLSFIICLDIWTQALTSQLFVPPLGGSWAGE